MRFVRNMLRDSFYRDIVILAIISIVIGSALASAVSMGANAYFSKTLSSLVGDYGEFDLVIQVREETKEDAEQQIQRILEDVFPGAKMKEGPTVTGKTNIFVALPDEFKTKPIYEDLGKTFGSIPGGAGVGFMTEPRLTIRGVPEGAKNLLMERIAAMEGVRFAFRDGGSIGVILTSLDNSVAVNKQIEALLKQYQVIEISFPVGSEPSNPVRLGEAIASDMQNQLKLEVARNVSVDGQNDDMTSLVSTMMELRRFLAAYASQVTIAPVDGVRLLKGDAVVFQGAAPNAPAAGEAPAKENVLVQVTDIQPDGSAIGTITQGDASQLTNLQGSKLENNLVGQPTGAASYRNPRQELGSALNETSKLVGQVPEFAQDAQNVAKIASGALDDYSTGVSAIEQTLDGVRSAGATIQAATNGLAAIDTRALQSQINSSSKAMGGVIGTLQVLKLLQADTNATIDSLTSTQGNLNNINNTLGALSNVTATAHQARAAIDGIVANGQTTLDTLKSFDAEGARANLNDINGRLAQVQQINTPMVASQLQYMAASAPSLKDEDINHSVQLLDKFIAGQVIPGERIQILTDGNVTTDAAAPIVHREAGHNNVSLYSTALGVIEPNPRGEVYRILSEVKAVLAGITAIVLTVAFLLLDHTAIMSAIRRKNLTGKVKVKGWRAVPAKILAVFTAPERRYGMLMGSVLLTAMFVLAGGGIPYLPWIGVPMLGALLGFVAAGYCEKISPIAAEEVMAGEALGLSFDEIMREVVVPAARPGLLQKLNTRKVKFR